MKTQLSAGFRLKLLRVARQSLENFLESLKKICGSNLAIKTRPIPLFEAYWQCLAMFSGKGDKVNKGVKKLKLLTNMWWPEVVQFHLWPPHIS